MIIKMNYKLLYWVIFSTSCNASPITQVLIPKSDNYNNNIYMYIFINII